MALPARDTLVSYPSGEVTVAGEVVHVEPMPDGRSAVVLDRTALHPVDTAWPDQPADRGRLVTSVGVVPVVDALTGGVHEGRLFLGTDLPVRTGTEGWTFVVAHVVEEEAPADGESVTVEVDAAYRAALSAGHTACHLASLALDAALADAWSKPVAEDAMGSPAFDALAIQTSRIVEFGSVDVYRVGKSLRRKGFRAEALDDLVAVADRANDLLTGWVAAGGAVRVECAGERLTDRRTWVCALPAGEVRIPCGGTHATSLRDLGSVTVALSVEHVEGARELTMRTTVRPAVHPAAD